MFLLAYEIVMYNDPNRLLVRIIYNNYYIIQYAVWMGGAGGVGALVCTLTFFHFSKFFLSSRRISVHNETISINTVAD